VIWSIFTYCRSLGLGWSDTRKSLIKNIETEVWKIIWNSNLKLPSAGNVIKHKSSQFVFDCLQNNVWTPFKTYFERSPHSKNTGYNGLTMKIPKVCLEFGTSFHYQGTNIFNELPIKSQFITSRLLFNKCLIICTNFVLLFTFFYLIFTIISFTGPFW